MTNSVRRPTDDEMAEIAELPGEAYNQANQAHAQQVSWTNNGTSYEPGHLAETRQQVAQAYRMLADAHTAHATAAMRVIREESGRAHRR